MKKTSTLFCLLFVSLCSCKSEPKKLESPQLMLGKSYVDSLCHVIKMAVYDSISEEKGMPIAESIFRKMVEIRSSMTKQDSISFMNYYYSERKKLDPLVNNVDKVRAERRRASRPQVDTLELGKLYVDSINVIYTQYKENKIPFDTYRKLTAPTKERLKELTRLSNDDDYEALNEYSEKKLNGRIFEYKIERRQKTVSPQDLLRIITQQ